MTTKPAHCEVVRDGRRAPGLVLEWRQIRGAWEGRVIYAAVVEGRWVTAEAWLSSAALDQV